MGGGIEIADVEVGFFQLNAGAIGRGGGGVLFLGACGGQREDQGKEAREKLLFHGYDSFREKIEKPQA